MSNAADVLYGSHPAPSAEHPWVDPATGTLAPAPGKPGQQPSAGASIFADDSPVQQGNPMMDGSVHSNLRSTLQDLVDSGQVEQSQAHLIGQTLTSEADAIGLAGGELDVAMRDLNRPVGDPKAAQAERGEAVRQLRAAYGDRAEATLAAGLKVLQSKAPLLSVALARSAAGNNPSLTMHVARLGERALKGGRR